MAALTLASGPHQPPLASLPRLAPSSLYPCSRTTSLKHQSSPTPSLLQTLSQTLASPTVSSELLTTRSGLHCPLFSAPMSLPGVAHPVVSWFQCPLITTSHPPRTLSPSCPGANPSSHTSASPPWKTCPELPKPGEGRLVTWGLRDPWGSQNPHAGVPFREK